LPEKELNYLKREIGRESLEPLLAFFTNAENPAEFRKWVCDVPCRIEYILIEA
jgi:hypothetical protein